MDFKVIMDDLKKKQAFEKPIITALSDVCSKEKTEAVIELLQRDEITPRTVYLELLKKFGRADGLAFYRVIKVYI